MSWFWSIQIFGAPPPSVTIFSEPPLNIFIPTPCHIKWTFPKVFIQIARSVAIFCKKWLSYLNTSLCGDENGLFIFSGRKRQQMRQTGQSRPTEKCETNCIKHCFVKSTTIKASTWTSFLHHKTTSISLCTAADSRVEQNRSDFISYLISIWCLQIRAWVPYGFIYFFIFLLTFWCFL